MTRGTLFYYESDNKVWESTEFNGDMYHHASGYEGIGNEVIKLMVELKSLGDFKAVLKEINKHYKYKEGNDCWSCGKAAVTRNINRTIKWIDEKRKNLKGDSHMDPREWKARPTFRDTNTWHFWGVPNLSDYSYIYNNSGKDLVMKTCDDGEMIIPNGYLGVLNYGSNDCLCKDGKIIDGMGHYKED